MAFAPAYSPIYDSRTKKLLGYSGPVQGAIYSNGMIVGYQGANTYWKPTSTTLPYTAPKTTTAVSGTEDVRNLSYGTTAQNRAATKPNQAPGANTPIASTGIGAFDYKGYLDKQNADYLDATQPKPPSTPEEIQKWIYDHFGYMAAYINDPEIGQILQDAARNEVTSEAQLFGMLSATRWWKTTSEVARKWDYLENTDPAEARRQKEAQAATIRNLAGTLGVGIEGNLDDLAGRMLRAGWTEEQAMDYLVSLVQGETSYTGGTLGSLQNDVRAEAAKYLIDISDQTSSNYARRIASGELTIEGAASVFAQQARARFPWLSESIDKGITPDMYFAPMRDQVARQLEMNVEDIDPMDPKWLDMLEVTDSASGERRGATGYELLGRVRGMNDYYKTNNAQSLYAGLATGLGQRLGVI